MLQIIALLIVLAFILSSIRIAQIALSETDEPSPVPVITWDSNGNGPRDHNGIRRFGSTRGSK